MQSFGTFLGDNKGLEVALAVLAVVVFVAILVVLYRFMFGRRLHMTGGRSRQPRLGVVDAFDLDRQRQLVLVRRDNVEHLLMIGGPNDVLIESAFQRVPSSVAVPLGRDKEASAPLSQVVPMPLPPGGMAEAAPAPARPPDGGQSAPGRTASPPMDLVEPVSPGDLGPLADIAAPGPVPATAPPSPPPPGTVAEPPPAAPFDLPPAAPAPPRPLPSRLNQPLPPRPAATGSLPPRPPLTSLRTPTANGTVPAAQRPSSLLPNRPTPLTPLQRGTSAASLRREPPSSAPPPPEGEPATVPASLPSPEPAPPSPSPVDPEPAVASAVPPGPPLMPLQSLSRSALPITVDSIESLEEEMAKLLGRATPDKK